MAKKKEKGTKTLLPLAAIVAIVIIVGLLLINRRDKLPTRTPSMQSETIMVEEENVVEDNSIMEDNGSVIER